MPAKRWLIAVFLVSFLTFLIAGLPAALVVQLVQKPLAASGVSVISASGTLWHGQGVWRWRDLRGQLGWELDWRGLRPGVTVDLEGPLALSGWVSGGPASVQLRDAELSMAGAMLERWQPQLKLGGRITGRNLGLSFRDKRVTDAAGELAYTGGQASWSTQKPVTVAPLKGVLESTDDGASLTVRDASEGSLLAQGSIAGNIGALKVYRAWVMMLELSRGGAPEDVVFETSMPLWQQD
jgi:general secretion pathway protein N